MTELLYLRDTYLREFTATVTKAEEERVALDRTAFYPNGGGQPHDTGTHRCNGERHRARTVTTCGTRSRARCRPWATRSPASSTGNGGTS